MYSALQTGIVDGQENPLVLSDTAKFCHRNFTAAAIAERQDFVSMTHSEQQNLTDRGACAIGRVSADDALWSIWPYLAALTVALAVVVAVPWLSIGFL